MKYCILLFLFTTSMLAVAQPKPHAPLTQQKMCADEAHKAFAWSHGSDKEAGNKGWTYTSHYDAESKVCYVMEHNVSSTAGNIGTSDLVFDAYEGRTYASYVWINTEKKKYWEVPPTECSVKPRGQDEITCKSSEEFERLVDKYFGIGR
jgi:hypothetical protein